jgi:uncharacterized cupin superfamily protein
MPPGSLSSASTWSSCHPAAGRRSATGTATRTSSSTGFPAGKPDGHHLINRTDRPAVYLEVGSRRDEVDECDYPDIDMAVRIVDGRQMYVRKHGEPYGPAPLPYQTSPGRTP